MVEAAEDWEKWMTIVTNRYETLLKEESTKAQEEPPSPSLYRSVTHGGGSTANMFNQNRNDLMRRSMRDTLPSNQNKSSAVISSSTRTQATLTSNSKPRQQQQQVKQLRASEMRRAAPAPAQRANSGPAGAVNEDDFRRAFSQVPQSVVNSEADVQNLLSGAQKSLEKTDEEWSKRVNALKIVRAVILKGGAEFEAAILRGLNGLEDALVYSIKDLRSQVLREVAITVSYMAETYGTKLSRLFEALLPHLLPIAANSARIMASSAVTANAIILRNVHYNKLLPLIVGQSTSKSKDVRRHAQELLGIILANWQPTELEKSINSIVEAVKGGICDADPGARQIARTSFQSLEAHFAPEAQRLYASLDPARQKTLTGGASAASSTTSINSDARLSTPMGSKLGIGRSLPKSGAFFTGRSASMVDAGAVRRATTAPSTNAAAAHHQPGATPTRPTGGFAIPNQPARFAKPYAPAAGVRAHQPPAAAPQANRLRTSAIGGAHFSRRSPVSKSNQFDTNSVRSAVDATLGGNGRGNRFPQTQTYDEDELEFMKPFSDTRQYGKVSLGGFASPTSTFGSSSAHYSSSTLADQTLLPVASPFSTGNISSDSAGLQNAIRACQASNPNEKREGVKALHYYLESRPELSHAEIKRISETLMRLLSDTSTKLLVPTSELVVAFVTGHHSQLADWIQPLLSRLLQKIGTEMVPTAATTIRQTLAAVRQAFDPELQFVAWAKYITDPIHTLATSVKAASLTYALDVAAALPPGTPLNRPEIQLAVKKLFQWKEEPKTHNLKPSIEKLLYGMFAVNASDYMLLMSAFDQHDRDYAHALLSRMGSSAQTHASKSNGSIPSGNGGSTANNSAEAATALGSPRPVAAHNPISNITFRQPATPHRNLPANNRYATNEQTSERSVEMLCGAIQDVAISSPRPSTQLVAGENDISEADKFVKGLLSDVQELREDDDSIIEEQKRALATLVQAIGNASVNVDWAKYFEELVLVAFQGLRSTLVGIQSHSLKLLDKLCASQPERFAEITSAALYNTLAVMATENSNLLAPVVDDTLKTLARQLPRSSLIDFASKVIHNVDDPRTASVLKMIAHVFEGLAPEQLNELLASNIATKIAECCNSSKVEVRKSAIFTLVGVILKLGEQPIKDALGKIQDVQRALLEHYLEKKRSSSRQNLSK